MKTLTNIRNHSAVESAVKDLDGYWIFLKDGYINPHLECGIIHERSLKECISQLNQIEHINPIKLK